MTDIDALSAGAYEDRDPIDWAATVISNLLAARDMMSTRKRNGLLPLAGWQDLSDQTVARKVIGFLLDAGWRPPADEDIADAVARSRAARERYRAWWATLTAAQQERVIEHFSGTGEWPSDLQPPTAVAS